MIETKLNGTTPDIAEENIAKLKEIFPDVFCEGKVDFEKLQQVLGNYVEDAKERYNFSWNGKGKSLKLAQSPSTGTLLPCKEESKDWDTTENLYIEGDNLEVLKLLHKSYHNKIKMIYIDPPYNTGHDFVYKDNFKDNLQNYLEITGQTDEDGNKMTTNSESNGRYHTDWLNMMYPRLRLARNLLTDDGVIFISIDDNEVANLKKLCDEILGEDNFVAQLIWQRAFSPKNDARYISNSHDYILMYAKILDSFTIGRLPRTEEANARYSNPDNDPRGVWTSGDLSVKTYNPATDYPITTPSGKIVEPPSGRCWRASKESLEALIADNRIYFGEDGNNTPRLKRFLSDLKHDGMSPTSILFHKEVGHSQEGSQELTKLLDAGVFDGPKPIRLLDRLLTLANLSNNDIILDFFSGSASIAQAVLQLNQKDGGNRKFICVQIPETTNEKSEAFNAGYKNICEIGKERIRRAGDKIKSEIEAANVQITLGEDEKKVPDIGFKVFKLNSSNIKKWQPDFDEIADYILNMENNFVDDRTELDVVYEIMIKYGLDLTYPVEELLCGDISLYSIGMGMLIICLANNIGTDVAKFISDYKKENEIDGMRVVFADCCFGGNDSLKTNIKEILKVAGVEEFITI